MADFWRLFRSVFFVKRLTVVLPTFICDVMYVEEICKIKKKAFYRLIWYFPLPSPLSQLKFYIADSANIDQ